MKRGLKLLLISIIMIGTITAVLISINHFIILTRIYYTINYKTDIQNSESLIEKSELFDYQKYCKYRDSWGEGPINSSNDYYYIDKEFVDSHKREIEKENKKFHYFYNYGHNFVYSLEVENKSLIYLTYNNKSIIKAEYTNHTEIFTADRCYDYYHDNYSANWEGCWYLNFTYIPLTFSNASTIVLNDIFLVKMRFESELDCGIQCGEHLMIEQFLCFNSNFQLMFVYIPLSLFSMA